MGAGMVLVAVTPAWWVLLPGYFLVGSGAALVDAGFNAHAAHHFSATTMNWMHAAFGLGATAGPPLMTWALVSRGSWRPGYAAAGAFFLCTAGAVAMLRRHLAPAPEGGHSGEGEMAAGASGGVLTVSPGAPASPAPPETSAAPALSALPTAPGAGNPGFFRVWGGVALFAIYTGVEASAGQLTFTLFTEGRGVDPVSAGMRVSGFWFALTAGRVFLGPVATRLGETRVLYGAFFLAVGAAVMLTAGVHTTADGVALAVLGFALGPIFPLLVLQTPHRVGAARAHDVIGYQMGAATFGVVVFAGLGGQLAGVLGVAVVAPYMLALAVAAVVLYGGVVRATIATNDTTR